MTLMEDLSGKFGKFYTVMAKCSNCQTVAEVKVPKGETIEEYFKSERGVCSNCKCATLEKYKKPDMKKEKESEKKAKVLWD